MLLLAIRFLVEILGVVALGYVGATVPAATAWRLIVGIGAPAALIVVWALVVAPKADNPLPPRARELLGTGLLLLVAGALAAAGQPEWGIVFAAVVAADQALLLALNAGGIAAAIAPAAPEGRS